MDISTGELEERLYFEFAKYEHSGELYDEKDREEAFKIAYIAIKHNRHLFNCCVIKEYALQIFKKEWAKVNERLYNAYCYSFIKYEYIMDLKLTVQMCKPRDIFTLSAWNLYIGEGGRLYDICIEHNQVVVKQLDVYGKKKQNVRVISATVIGQLPDKTILLRYPLLLDDYTITCTREPDDSGYIVMCNQQKFKYKTSVLINKLDVVRDNDCGYIKYPEYKGSIIMYLYFPNYINPIHEYGQDLTTPNIHIIYRKTQEPYNSRWIKK